MDRSKRVNDAGVLKHLRLSKKFWLLISLLFFVSLFGGSARADVWSLILLRPIAVIIACLGLRTINCDQIRDNWFLFAMLGAAAAMTAIHLLPLPYALWSAIPGRAIITEIDHVAGFQHLWRPLTMAPAATRNALYSMIVPFAVLVVGVQLSPAEMRRLLPVFIVLGLVSAIIASLQLLGPADSPLYFYKITNEGAAVGFFANRNHQALMLSFLLLMLGAYAAESETDSRDMRPRLMLCFAIGVFLIPLILLTGSRGGLLFGALSAAGAIVLYRSRGGSRATPGRLFARRGAPLAFALLVPLIWWTVWSGRAESVQRFIELDANDSVRREAWTVVADALPHLLPFGTGIGSYEKVYRILEPAALVRSSYSNHVHNDWIEVVMTAGLFGGVWLLASVFAFILLVRSAWRATRAGQHSILSWTGCLIILIIGLSSGVDYPLRVPIITSIFVVACLWAKLQVTAGARK